MNATRQSPWRSRRIVLLLASMAALALTLTPLASTQPVENVGGSATGEGFYNATPPAERLILGALGPPPGTVTGTPQAATGSVHWGENGGGFDGVARCIAIDETATGFRASIAGEIILNINPNASFQGFEVTVYDNTPSAQIDQASSMGLYSEPRTSCTFDRGADFTLSAGDFTVVPLAVCPPNNDDDGDGLTNNNESLFFTLLDSDDSDLDGVADGNDDANGNGEDDEDEDDDDGDDECPDEDSDDDGEDDEDEDDDDDD
jgi:hypothetical protein